MQSPSSTRKRLGKRRRADSTDITNVSKLYTQFPDVWLISANKITTMPIERQQAFCRLWVECKKVNKHVPFPKVIGSEFDVPSFAEIAVKLNQTSVINLIPVDQLKNKNADGYTLFHVACQEGHIASLVTLGKRCLDLIYETAKNQTTALHIAAQHGHFRVLRYLFTTLNKLQRKKPLDTSTLFHQDKMGNNVAHLACAWGQKQVIQYLKKTAPNLFKVKNTIGERPVDSAITHDRVEILPLFCISSDKHHDMFRSANDGLLRWALGQPKLSMKCIHFFFHKDTSLFKKINAWPWAMLLANWDLDCDLSDPTLKNMLEKELSNFFSNKEPQQADLLNQILGCVIDEWNKDVQVTLSS